MKLLRVTRVLKIMVWVRSAKKASGLIKSQVGFWPDLFLITIIVTKTRNHATDSNTEMSTCIHIQEFDELLSH